uniref:microtubule-associated protein 10 isoform X2 n=1 Tax=Myxine glutinosa TaxID=7769 RepID=UPI00358DF798
MATAQLFSLELLVDSVRLNQVTETCRSPALVLRFMDFPAMILHPGKRKGDVQMSEEKRREDDDVAKGNPHNSGDRLCDEQDLTREVRASLVFNSGKSCLFSFDAAALGARLVTSPVRVMLIDCYPGPEASRMLGSTSVTLTGALAMLQTDVDQESSAEPWGHGERGTYGLRNPMGETIGTLTIGYRLFGLGGWSTTRSSSAPSVEKILMSNSGLVGNGKRIEQETPDKAESETSKRDLPLVDDRRAMAATCAHAISAGTKTIANHDTEGLCSVQQLAHDCRVEQERGFDAAQDYDVGHVIYPPPLYYNSNAEEQLSDVELHVEHEHATTDLKYRLDPRHREPCAEKHSLENSQPNELRQQHSVDEQRNCTNGWSRRLRSSAPSEEHLGQRQLVRRKKLKQNFTGSHPRRNRFARRKEPLNYGLTHTFRLRLQHTTNALAQCTQSMGPCNVEGKCSKRTRQTNSLEGKEMIQKSMSDKILFSDKGVQVVMKDMCEERLGGELHAGTHLPGGLTCLAGIDKSVQTIPGPWLEIISSNFQETELKDRSSVPERSAPLIRRLSELSVKDESVHSKYSPSAAQSESNIPSLKHIKMAGKCTLDDASSEEEEDEYSDDFSGSFESLSVRVPRTSCALENGNKTVLSASPSDQQFSEIHENGSDFIFHTDPETIETGSESGSSERTSTSSGGNGKLVSQEPEGNPRTPSDVSLPIVSLLRLNEIGFDGTSAAKSHSLDGSWYGPVQQTALYRFQPRARLLDTSAMHKATVTHLQKTVCKKDSSTPSPPFQRESSFNMPLEGTIDILDSLLNFNSTDKIRESLSDELNHLRWTTKLPD